MRSVLEHLAAVQWTALAVAVAFQVLKLVVRSRAWHNLLQAAFPAAGLRWGAVAGAVLVSAGVNSAAPARLGDLVKVAVVRRGLGARCCLPTIGATMVAEALLDLAVAVLLVGAVVASGRLVGHGEVARAVLGAAGEAAARPWLATACAGAVVAIAVALRLAARGRLGRLRGAITGVRAGLAGLREPRRYARDVASWQILSWGLRVGCVFFALRAFGIDATLELALLVVAAQILSSLVPVAGGAGTQQALVVVALHGHASVSEAVAFSLGLQATVMATNILVAGGVGAVAVQRIGTRGVRALLPWPRRYQSVGL